MCPAKIGAGDIWIFLYCNNLLTLKIRRADIFIYYKELKTCDMQCLGERIC